MIYSVFVLIMFYVTFFDVRSHCSAVCSASSCVSARGWIWISQIKQSSARNFPHFDFRERVEICCVRWVQRKKFLRWLWGERDRDFIQPVADWYIQTFRHYPEMTIASQPIASTLPSLHFVRIRGLTNFSNSQSLIFGKISSIVKSGDFIRWLMLRVSFKHTRGRLEFNFVYISLCAKGISLLHCGRKVFFFSEKITHLLSQFGEHGNQFLTGFTWAQTKPPVSDYWGKITCCEQVVEWALSQPLASLHTIRNERK